MTTVPISCSSLETTNYNNSQTQSEIKRLQKAFLEKPFVIRDGRNSIPALTTSQELILSWDFKMGKKINLPMRVFLLIKTLENYIKEPHQLKFTSLLTNIPRDLIDQVPKRLLIRICIKSLNNKGIKETIREINTRLVFDTYASILEEINECKEMIELAQAFRANNNGCEDITSFIETLSSEELKKHQCWPLRFSFRSEDEWSERKCFIPKVIKHLQGNQDIPTVILFQGILPQQIPDFQTLLPSWSFAGNSNLIGLSPDWSIKKRYVKDSLVGVLAKKKNTNENCWFFNYSRNPEAYFLNVFCDIIRTITTLTNEVKDFYLAGDFQFSRDFLGPDLYWLFAKSMRDFRTAGNFYCPVEIMTTTSAGFPDSSEKVSINQFGNFDACVNHNIFIGTFHNISFAFRHPVAYDLASKELVDLNDKEKLSQAMRERHFVSPHFLQGVVIEHKINEE